VLDAVSESINRTLVKQAAFPARQENVNISKEKKNV
jgi:hypothetical protein